MSVVMGCVVPHPPVLIPEIGGSRAADIETTKRAMEEVADELATKEVATVVLISPHGRAFNSAMGVATAASSFGDLSMWGPSGLNFEFKNDLEFVELLQNECRKLRVPLQSIGESGYELDHGALVPLYFLQRGMPGARLVPVTFSWLDTAAHLAFGQAIGRASLASGRRVGIIASGDLSHRLTRDAPAGYDPQGAVFDRLLVDAVKDWSGKAILGFDPALVQRAGECGLRSVIILLGALEGLRTAPRVLSYEGPFGVGYMVASVPVEPSSLVGETDSAVSSTSAIVQLARETVEAYVRDSIVKEPEVRCEEMGERAGVFVCLKKHGDLRGCIGTFEAMYGTVAEEIVHNAISAATRDPRFLPVTVSELPHLTYSVDILTPPEAIDGPDQLDPKRYGVIVESRGRRGLLLPDLDGVDTVEQQVDIARRKAFIGPEEKMQLQRFEVRRFE